LEPLLTKYVREPNCFTLDFYLKHEGYDGLKKALAMPPDQVIETVKASGLRGRGGAGFPTGMKWQFVDKKSPNPKYIACNADESEPGTFKDHLLMERNPHLLIEGCAIACYAIGAKIAYIYIRGEFFHVQHVLERAIDEAYAAGFLGRNVLGLRLRRLHAPRRRRLRGGGGDGAARIAGRQARPTAQQAAVSGCRRPL
jgi:NADH-quinone oxidoreductase subunit F